MVIIPIFHPFAGDQYRDLESSHVWQVMKAETIGTLTRDLHYYSHWAGKVSCAFDRAVYITSPDQVLVCLTSADIKSSWTLTATSATPQPFCGIMGGMQVQKRGSWLVIEEGHLAIQLSKAQIWEPPLIAGEIWGGYEDLRNRLLQLAVVCQTYQNRSELLQLLPLMLDRQETFSPAGLSSLGSLALPALLRLLHGIDENDSSLIVDATAGIAGLGPGLTPLGDDILFGIMSTLSIAGPSFGISRELIASLNGSILKGAIGQTTELSFDLLRYAARGGVCDAQCRLISGVLFDPTQVAAAIDDLLRIGASSGEGLLAGAFLGLDVSYRKSLLEGKIEAMPSPPREGTEN